MPFDSLDSGTYCDFLRESNETNGREVSRVNVERPAVSTRIVCACCTSVSDFKISKVISLNGRSKFSNSPHNADKHVRSWHAINPLVFLL